MESFLHSLLRINWDDDTLLLLSHFITNDQHPSPPPRLYGLRRNLHEFGLRFLWHAIFSRFLNSAISSDKLQATLLVAIIIKLLLSTLCRVYIKRYDMVNLTLSGYIQLEEIINLRNEVIEVLHSEDFTLFLIALMLRI